VPVESSAGRWRAIDRHFIENNNRVGGLVTPQGIGGGGQPSLVGGKGQPNKPINANWQAAFLLSLVGPAEFSELWYSLHTLPIALSAGRWAVKYYSGS